MCLFILALSHWLVPPLQRWLRADVSTLFCFQRILLSLSGGVVVLVYTIGFPSWNSTEFCRLFSQISPWNLTDWGRLWSVKRVSLPTEMSLWCSPFSVSELSWDSQAHMFYSALWFYSVWWGAGKSDALPS